METLLIVVALLAAFVAGILVAPKAHKYEAAWGSELHALYIAGALREDHVWEWFDLKLSKMRAEAAGAAAAARAGINKVEKDVSAVDQL